MPSSSDFPYPRRYNSLRLLGFDYASTSALYFVTVDTDSSRPVFGDIKLAKAILGALLNSQTQARIRMQAYTLLPDHLHLLAGVREGGRPLSAALMEWRAALIPEAMEMKNWPRVLPEHFLGKHLWHTKFNDHIIRNDADLRETIEYIAQNPVKRGYVSKPQFYPFTGFGVDVTKE